MTDVFLVQHGRVVGDDRENIKVIGVYSSCVLAEAPVRRLRLKPSFEDTPDGFYIDRYETDKDHWTAGFVAV